MNDWQTFRNSALEILGSLAPDLYQSRYDELLRGGLSANSMPEGARSSEKPLPGFDNFDVNLQREHRNQNADWVLVLEVARRLESRENALLLVMGVSIPTYDEDNPVPHRKMMAKAVSKATQELTNETQGAVRFHCLECGKDKKRKGTQRSYGGRCFECHTEWVAAGMPLRAARNDSDSDVESTRFECANLLCRRPLEVGTKSGECGRCRTHRSRFARPWPDKGEPANGEETSTVTG